VPAIEKPAKGWEARTIDEIHQLVKHLLEPELFSRLAKTPKGRQIHPKKPTK
jgi:hypothetical protein